MSALPEYFAPTPKRARPLRDAADLPQPSYVRACAGRHWRILVWDAPGGPAREIVFRCNSWRHEGECANRAIARCFVRTKEALEGAPVGDLVYCVLTLDQRSEGRTFTDPIDAYRGLGLCLAKMIRDLRRAWPGEPVHYVATVERHRSGWPHVNVVIRSASLADYVRGWVGEDRRPDPWLAGLQSRAGFGPIGWWEPVRDRGAIADYVSKVAGDFLANAGKLSGELVKVTQLPINAPSRMRRIRSSRGFLPPAKREKKVFAGVLQRNSCDPDAQSPDHRVWYEGHLRRQGLTVGEDWMLVPAAQIVETHDHATWAWASDPWEEDRRRWPTLTWIDAGMPPDPDDRAIMFGSIEREAGRTREQREWLAGRHAENEDRTSKVARADHDRPAERRTDRNRGVPRQQDLRDPR